MFTHALSTWKSCSAMAIVLAMIVLAGCGQSSRQTVDSGGQSALITGEEILIDGILNEPCWTDAVAWTLKSAVGDDDLALPTTVRAVFDDSKLYIGIECQDTDAASTVTGRDAAVFSEEHVTVYLDANSDRSTYALIEIAPTGAVRDAFVVSTPDGSREQVLAEWDCDGSRASVSVYGGGPAPGTEDRFWTVEIALPFKALYTASDVPPADGDSWLWNVSRVDFTNDRELSVLSPTGSDRFHVPAAFSRMIFKRQ